MIVFHYTFNKFEFISAYSFQDEFSIASVIEERSTFTTRDQFCKRLEISIEHITKDVIGSQTLRIEVFLNAEGFSDTCKDLRCVIIESASFDVIIGACPIWSKFILTLYIVLLLSDI